MNEITGLHHITAISSDAQKTYDFYTKILGLRLIKKTVNFDAPDVYHLYFGDEAGTPGTILTFFPFTDSGTGLRGPGQVTSIAFAVNKKSLGFWLERFIKFNVKHKNILKKFGESVIIFFDKDGMQLELVGVEANANKLKYWKESEIEEQDSILCFHSATLSVNDLEKTEKVLINLFGYKKQSKEELTTRYKLGGNDFNTYIDLLEMKGWPEAVQGAGTVHHIAFGVENDEAELKFIEKIKDFGLHPTDIIDRNYFNSVYFREPNGILFELATKNPGFLIDENKEELGSNLKLPEKYEDLRHQIIKILPKLNTENQKEEKDLSYDHIFLHGESKRTLILLHGTGGDESDLIPLAESIDPKANILSLRGKEVENGMLRFFMRFPDGKFDQDDLRNRAEEISNFIAEAQAKYHFDIEESIFLGYSNGANMIASMILLDKNIVKKAILLKATQPLDSLKKSDRISENFKDIRVFMANGSHDDYTPIEKIEELKDYLASNGANVTSFLRDGGHELKEEDVEEVKGWYRTV